MGVALKAGIYLSIFSYYF